MNDDDFVEAVGSAESEPALEPGDVAAGTDDDGGKDHFEASAPQNPSERIGRVRIPRTSAGRAAMVEAMAKFKAEKTADDDVGDFGPTDEEATGAPAKVTRAASPAATVPVKTAAEAAPIATAPPPAPSLDPEVGRLRQTLAAEIEKQRALTTEAETRAAAAVGPVEHTEYLESAPKSYRKWVESMRGEPMSDDEFRQEAADFVTLMSGEVLGVKLPDEVKARIEAQLARKAFTSYKKQDQKRAATETAKAEAARVDQEWDQAAQALNGQFRVEATAKEYAYLAAEDSPGAIVVDVIKSAKRRDGTVLSWQEASKQANDYLKKSISVYVDKRKHLLSVAAPAEPAAKAEARPGRPPGTQQVTRAPEPQQPAQPTSDLPVVRRANPTWSKEAHRRGTREAFREVFKPES